MFTDTVTFLDYNDNMDYMLLNAKKDDSDYGYVNDNNADRSYLKGDVIEIKWKEDTIKLQEMAKQLNLPNG